MTEKEIELMKKENALLWSMVDTKNKANSELCRIISDLEERLKHADS